MTSVIKTGGERLLKWWGLEKKLISLSIEITVQTWEYNRY